jgi:hypothetical protein
MENRTAKATEQFQDTAVADAYPAPRFSFDFAPTGMTIDTSSGAISWMPTMQQLGASTVIVRATNGAGFDQANFTVTVTGPDAVTTPGAPLNFNVGNSFPNPVSEALGQSVFIPVDAQIPVVLTVRLFTTLGAEIFSYTTESLNSGSHELEINTSALRCGTYFYSVTDGRTMHRGAIVVIP